MTDARRRVRTWIAITAGVLLGILLALRQAGIERDLLRILAIGAGLLVTLLIVTYRALVKAVDAAKANPNPPPWDDDEDER